MTPKTPKPLHSPLLAKPHRWIVYRLDDSRIRATLIQTQGDLEYFKARADIVASTLVTAFNRSEAWHKGKDSLES